MEKIDDQETLENDTSLNSPLKNFDASFSGTIGDFYSDDKGSLIDGDDQKSDEVGFGAGVTGEVGARDTFQ